MYVVVLVTCSDEKEAKKLSDIVLNERLAACVNLIHGVKSYFWWGSKTHDAEEVLMFVKTKEELLRELIKKVKENHSYETPEIIALPIIGGSKEYTRWIDEETK